MKKIFTLTIASFFYVIQIFAQTCSITGSSTTDTLVCGGSVLLSAYGQAQGIALLTENFNGGTYGPGWAATQQATWNNPCSPNGVNNTTHIWMGSSSPVPRILTTASFNLSSCTNAGVTICFDMLFAEQGNSAPCEGPDEPQEGVYVQYSIDNGATWVDIHYFDPNGGNDPQLVNWNNWCFPVPAAALTANTKFRWFQDADSGADYDHWGIDNVVIYCNDPNYNIVWQHDGYNAGPVGGTNPNAVSPQTTTSYVVTMTNGTVICRDTVTIVVRNPTVVVNAGNDTTVCNGQCALLNATAKVVPFPGGTRKYRTTEPDTVTAIGGGFSPALVDINVTNLNMATVGGGSIASVCIDSASAVDIIFPGFPPIIPPSVISNFNIDQFSFELVCPDGTVIMLVPSDTVLNTGNDYISTCFVPGGTAIGSSSPPNTGNFSPQQPFTNFNSCSANGVWSLRVGSAFGTAIIKGWSITFNDPEISYTGNFNWTPTTNMTGSNTLTPTVCPPPNSYTLTVSDTAGCVTQSDVININTQSCCGLSALVTTTQPTCGASTGTINVTPAPVGAYTYDWADLAGTINPQNRTGLAAGTYTVTVSSVSSPTCTWDTSITLNSNSTLLVSLNNPINPTCAGNDGSVQATINGGTAPYTVTIDTGGTPQSFSLPIPINNQSVPNVPAGAVLLTVVDAQGCTASANVTLTAPVNCCSFTLSAVLTQPTCAQSNGSIVATPANGSGNYTYAWSNSTSASSITGVPANTYLLTVTDNGFTNCFIDTSFVLNSNSTLLVSLANPVNPTCAGNDGSVEATINGGTAPYTVTIDTGGTPQSFSLPIPITNQSVPNVPAGAVLLTVVDVQGCTASANVTLTAPANCCTFTVSAVLTQPACAQSNGSIALTIANGSGNYNYLWSDASTGTSLNNVPAGNYLVTITDVSFVNCFIDTQFALTNPNAPVIDSFKILDVSCTGGGSDGSVTVFASSPNGINVTTGYTWSNTSTDNDDTQAGIVAGVYLFTVTDLVGCSTPGSVTIGVQPGCCFLQNSASVIPPTCGLNNATITISISTAGNPPYSYSIDGVNYQASNIFNNIASGNYDAITTDANLCSDTTAVVVPASVNSLLVTVTPTNLTCFGANDGTATATVAGGTLPFGYLWSSGDVSSSIASLAPNIYSVTVTDQTNCTGSASATVTEPAPLVIDLGADVAVCETTPVSLDAGSGYASYLWSTNEISQTIIPSATGVYTVIVTDVNGCTASDNVSATLVASPVIDLGEDKIVYEGNNAGLFANLISGVENGTYNWQPDTLLNCYDCANVVAMAYDSINYTVVYTDPYGCTATDNINIWVLPVGDVFFPNAFSPTGDGNNDVFLPYGTGVKEINWKVFNRWGEKVFESNSLFYGCDGTYKGQPLPGGVYVYHAKVTLLNNSSRYYKGSVTLIR